MQGSQQIAEPQGRNNGTSYKIDMGLSVAHAAPTVFTIGDIPCRISSSLRSNDLASLTGGMSISEPAEDSWAELVIFFRSICVL